MKRYLFDKIEVLGDGVQFIPFRKATILESFSAFTHTSFNQEDWEFIPTSFNEFLKMLEKTRLDESNDYKVTINLPMREEPLSFETMLQGFASEMYKDKPVDEKELAEFYASAYKIRKDARENRKLLEVAPAEFSK